jgi:hypothetical protein
LWDCLCNAVQAAAFRHAADLPPTFLSEGIVANNGCGLPYAGVVPCCTRTRHGRANWAMPVVEVRMLSLQAKCARSVRAAIFRSKMARTAKNAIRTRKPSCGFLRILTTPIIRCARLFTLACRTKQDERDRRVCRNVQPVLFLCRLRDRACCLGHCRGARSL